MGQNAPWISVILQTSIQIPYEFLLKLATVGVILIATWIISKIMGSLISKAARKLSLNVAFQGRRTVTWLVWLIGILISLGQFGLESTVLLVILTLGGIALMISLRDILSNIASREVITTYSQFKIGDWIQVGKYSGRVVDITSMNTILMTSDNETVYIPNAKVTKNTVINRTASGETRISISLTVDDTVDLSDVERILLEIGAELKEELASDSKPEVRVTNVDNRSIKVALLLKIHNPSKGALIASEVRKRAKMRLDEARIRSTRDKTGVLQPQIEALTS